MPLERLGGWDVFGVLRSRRNSAMSLEQSEQRGLRDKARVIVKSFILWVLQAMMRGVDFILIE